MYLTAHNAVSDLAVVDLSLDHNLATIVSDRKHDGDRVHGTRQVRSFTTSFNAEGGGTVSFDRDFQFDAINDAFELELVVVLFEGASRDGDGERPDL